jgi:hypothetical protein
MKTLLDELLVEFFKIILRLGLKHGIVFMSDGSPIYSLKKKRKD